MAMGMLSPSVMWADDAEKVAFFEQKIRPVLVERCYGCHSGTADEVQGKLWLDSRAGWQTGGESGPAIVPGKPEMSLLFQAIRRADKDLAMPPDEELPAAVVQDFMAWIQQGAVDPRDAATVVPVSDKAGERVLTDRERWAFTRPVKADPPAVRHADRVVSPIDKFVLAKLETNGLSLAAPASPEQLVRRLHFDLNGLPPTPEEVDSFLAAAREDRQRAVTDRVNELLSRPAYGEKWGRYWLDCVRYADSLDARGSGNEGDILDAWRYRDWVVSALNRDMPYDEFVRDQIAGDLRGKQPWNAERVVATGMYAIGNWGNGDSDKQKVYTDIVDDQVDVTSRAFMGLTVSCARCHDHKFDPISTADYYGLAGFFFSSHILERFADPTAGESLMRITVSPPEVQEKRSAMLARIGEIEARLSNGLKPLTERRENVAGRSELVAWAEPKKDNPSLTVNRGDEAISFSTIRLPGRAACVHPGPTEMVTIAWQSPVAGEVEVVATLSDADGNCGDGVRWSLRTGETVLSEDVLPNGGKNVARTVRAEVQAGQLVRLRIEPQGNYFCDSTQVELAVRSVAGDRAWSFTDALLKPETAQNVEAGSFLVCAGDAPQFGHQIPDRDALVAERDRLKGELPTLEKCQGLQDGGVPGSKYAGFHDAPIHVRGSYKRLAAVQPRGFPAVFKAATPALTGSGRAELADWVASKEQPLTARVFVNRLWQHHFGRGIVATPNNFGKLGTPPTHPELLDWLAVTFMERGWSVKEMHRLLCTSAVYQQSSEASPEALEHDADNLLLSRQQRRKLTAEELRDNLLAVTGQLDRTLGGPAVPTLTTPRRTLYLKTIRSDRTSYQLLFDGADPTSIVEQRNDSIVAPQALWLLNQPFALAQANTLAGQIVGAGGQDRTLRLQTLIKRLYGRDARPEELELLGGFLERSGDSEQAWKKVCHTLICANEFVFVD